MPHRGADQYLRVDERRGRHGHSAQHPIVHPSLPGPRGPTRRRHQRNCHSEAEKDLRKAGVRRGNGGRKEEQHGDAAEHPLQNDGTQRRKPQRAHPSARLRPPQPEREHDRQQSHARGNQPMAMLIKNSADHVSEWKGVHRPAVAGRPVRHRQAGAGAGDEAAGNDQKNCGSGNEFRVAGQPRGGC